MYLPTFTEGWEAYIRNSEMKCKEFQDQIESILVLAMNSALDVFSKGLHLEDPWLRHLDWTVKPIRMVQKKISINGVINPASTFNNSNETIERLPKWAKGLIGFY
jgi:hypothetical protein